MKLSFVIPAYNEEETLAPLAEQIAENVGGAEYEIIFVNDGSTDGTAAAIDKLTQNDVSISAIHFSVNRGKSAALAAGFARAAGDAVITLDADLQDDPREIPKLLEKLNEGADLVCGWKAVRHDPWHKTLPSRIYNACAARIFGLSLHDINCGYKAMTSEVAKALPLYGDRHRLIPVLASHLGYSVAEVAVEHQPRRHGHSKYGLERFTKGAADVMSLWFLTKYGESPGHFFFKWGAIFSGVSMLLFGVSLYFLSRGISNDAGSDMVVAGIAGVAIALAFAVWAGLAFGFGLLGELVVARANETKREQG